MYIGKQKYTVKPLFLCHHDAIVKVIIEIFVLNKNDFTGIEHSFVVEQGTVSSFSVPQKRMPDCRLEKDLQNISLITLTMAAVTILS